MIAPLLFTVPFISGQDVKEWNWTDGYHKTRTRADLDTILREHKQGKPVDLSYADLSGADLFQADLRDANLLGAKLEHARLVGALLENAYLQGAILSNADLGEAHMQGVNLIDSELKDARLNSADLTKVTFEPKSMPEIRFMAGAEHLELLTYWKTPIALVQLRKQFQDGGFRSQERKITYALKHREAELLWENCTDEFKSLDCSAYVFNRLFFDLTCQYGMNPGRPVRLLGWLWLLCSFLNYLFIRLSKHSGLFVVPSRKPSSENKDPQTEALRLQRIQKIGSLKVKSDSLYGSIQQQLKKRSSASRLKGGLKGTRRWLRHKWRLERAAMFFSLMSAFNIGFRDINFGRWLRLLTKREYDIKAVGWARVLAGFQSLVSVYLVALWILTYFGRPFE